MGIYMEHRMHRAGLFFISVGFTSLDTREFSNCWTDTRSIAYMFLPTKPSEFIQSPSHKTERKLFSISNNLLFFFFSTFLPYVSTEVRIVWLVIVMCVWNMLTPWSVFLLPMTIIRPVNLKISPSPLPISNIPFFQMPSSLSGLVNRPTEVLARDWAENASLYVNTIEPASVNIYQAFTTIIFMLHWFLLIY